MLTFIKTTGKKTLIFNIELIKFNRTLLLHLHLNLYYNNLIIGFITEELLYQLSKIFYTLLLNKNLLFLIQ